MSISQKLTTIPLLLTWSQYSRRSGMKSTAKKTRRTLQRVEKKLLLLEQERRHLLLRSKELEQRLSSLSHRSLELYNQDLTQLQPLPKELSPAWQNLLKQELPQSRE